ncbi:alpha/beta fold hydrolase [Thalassomonas sp. M1454]|uniref:alpha/beta fold hydrolase n=1 Tax=Thalassomonas sp. M1454 TaxID=2594477 RepID=UPI00117E2B98|nr:alpha/beta hydrolase [Thalassomonas sp. M1454]TRX57127.1 alpha/beta hydrolase [Thalassomonas sp. M1454]
MRDINFELADKTISAVAIGNEDKPVVLCLHGWLDNAASFFPLFKQLQQDFPQLLERYQFIAIDWPGHGLSTHRSIDAHYHFIDWCYDLLQIIEHKQWQKVSIIGHSMGGMVANAFTSAFNDKVDKLMLIEAIGLLTESENPSKQLRKGLQSRIKKAPRKLNVHKNLDAAIQARMNVSDLPNSAAELIVKRGIIEVENGVSWRSDPRLRNTSPQRFSLKQAIQVVANIHCPVTLIVGSSGFDMVQTGIKVFAEHINDFNCFTIEGGHHPHMESSGKTAELVNNLLK